MSDKQILQTLKPIDETVPIYTPVYWSGPEELPRVSAAFLVALMALSITVLSVAIVSLALWGA